MNNEDRKYLQKLLKMRPSLEVFRKLVQILADEQQKTHELSALADTSLLEISIKNT